MTVDTVIEGGTIVTEHGQFEAGLAIDDGEIAAVADEGSLPDAEERVDASGHLVMPGAVDVHVHIDDMFSEDTYETATSAAAVGGTTTYVDFAWQAWEGELSIFDGEGTLLEGVERKIEKGEDALVDFSLHGAITREDDAVLEEIPDVIDAGVTSFKMFTAYEIGLGNGFMNTVMQEIAANDAVGVFHTEDGSVCDALTEQFQAEGKGDPEWYPKSRPDYAEAMAAEDAVRMATEAGMKYYGIHTSCRKSADVLEQFQEEYGEGLVRAETCTHYTTLDDSIYAEMGNKPMIAPPIRAEDDVEAMFEQLGSGVLDVVSTDHCAYRLDQKNVDNWWDSAFGANALQASLPVFYDEAVNRRGHDPSFVVEHMSANPARIFGMPEKATLEPGNDADIVLFDPDAEYTITAEDNVGNAEFSIYEGRSVTGRPTKTFVRGEVVAEDGAVVGDAGYGEFVERDIPEW
ncbi:dihydroorotase [Natronomonas sp.]|uniref:dihydroorotase n=1 Tax=Natronomonas sp. TaxID=2184060 RepID=UPI00261E972F|nr:amidohydrolase family protein [Natronomonas sp.]